ncbi:MAG: hypothetical protein PHQ27_05785 [Victivallales bacterium]|nr:hypothetical protein [Victivallales bacterium]
MAAPNVPPLTAAVENNIKKARKKDKDNLLYAPTALFYFSLLQEKCRYRRPAVSGTEQQ